MAERTYTQREWDAIQRAKATGCDHPGFVRTITGGGVFNRHDVCPDCGAFRWASESQTTEWTLYPEDMRA